MGYVGQTEIRLNKLIFVILLDISVYGAIIKACADGVNIITGDGNMNTLKALWINSDSFKLDDNIQTKIRKDLGVTESGRLTITECQPEELAQCLNGNYDYFIITVNRKDLVQKMCDLLNRRGKGGTVLVLSAEKVKEADDHDWKVILPCGAHYMIYSKLLTPIIQRETGIITAFE